MESLAIGRTNVGTPRHISRASSDAVCMRRIARTIAQPVFTQSRLAGAPGLRTRQDQRSDSRTAMAEDSDCPVADALRAEREQNASDRPIEV